MIPYFQIQPFQFLSLSIHLFEILTSIGIWLGISTTLRDAQNKKLQIKTVIDALMVSIGFGFFGAHWMHVWFYEGDFTHPLRLIELWKGISSTGGLLIGACACWIFLRVKRVPILMYGDPILHGLVVAMFWGRLGCTVAHDHLGRLTTFPLAVQYSEGTRHNLGMYEAILLGLFLIIVHRKKIRTWLYEKPGRWTCILTLFYGIIRFLLDFLRADDLSVSDPRYAGLTPAQYVCILFVFAGVCLIYKKQVIK